MMSLYKNGRDYTSGYWEMELKESIELDIIDKNELTPIELITEVCERELLFLEQMVKGNHIKFKYAEFWIEQ